MFLAANPIKKTFVPEKYESHQPIIYTIYVYHEKKMKNNESRVVFIEIHLRVRR